MGKLEKTIDSLIRKGYLELYPKNEIGLTEKGLKASLELKEIEDKKFKRLYGSE